jgi:translocation and assembly module TamB
VAGEIAIEGPAGDPLLSGNIRIAEGAVRFGDLPPLESLTAKASMARRSLTLETVSGTIGGSPFTLAGSVDFSRLDDPTLNLRLQGKDALLYRDAGLRVRADSDLTLSGPVSALSLAGEVALTNSLYQKTFSVVDLFSGRGKSSKRAAPGSTAISFPEPPLRDMRFDVRLTARQPFKIETTVVRGTARPDLRLTGTGLLPILRGPILVDAAQVILPSGTLEMDRGSVLFGDKGPGRPVLDFGGRMQVSGYEITALIRGTLDSPEVVLASNPPLMQEELLLFVLTGAPPSGGVSGESVSAAATPMAVYLGKGVLDEILGGGEPGKGSDLAGRLELQIGRETTNSGSATVDARLRLKKNFIAKGSTLYLTSEKDVYDQENLGLKIIFKYK